MRAKTTSRGRTGTAHIVKLKQEENSMETTATLKVGDTVNFYGSVCEVVEVFKNSEIIAVRRHGNKGYIAYVSAWKCKKVR